MQGWHYLFGVSALAIGLVSTAEASESYDNPSMGKTPCVVLNNYQASSDGADSFGAAATIENVCGRSMEVAFCFPLIAPDGEAEPHCTSGLLRPWAISTIEVSDLPARLAGPDYQWRWHGDLTNEDR